MTKEMSKKDSLRLNQLQLQLRLQENIKLCSYLVVSFNFEMKWLLQYVTLWKKLVLFFFFFLPALKEFDPLFPALKFLKTKKKFVESHTCPF